MRLDETIDVIELHYAQGWTDGLPVVPLTMAALAPEAVRWCATAHGGAHY